MLRLDSSHTDAFIADHVRQGLSNRAEAAHRALIEGSGAGNEWLGWRRILQSPNDALLEDITSLASEIRERADVLLCVGIGGSYLGAEAVIQALSPYFPAPAPEPASGGLFDAPTPASSPEILFAGHHLSGRYLNQLMTHLEGKSVYVNVISKSGTTLEPAIAFRVIRQWMEQQFDDADRRIIATTDAERGALRGLAQEKGYRTYTIDADVGGRFSVLTPVGLLPIAAAGFDIRTLFYGAVSMMNHLESADNNPAVAYAQTRYALHESGYTSEVLSFFEPALSGVGGWWQQLFGESEGKERKGLLPVTCQFSTDLHSLGQYLQEGKRNLVETFLMVGSARVDQTIPTFASDADDSSPDGLAFVADRSLSEVTRAAYEGTLAAHVAGGVPVQSIEVDELNEETLGGLIYFFEHAVAVGGYLLGINPFDQPGVEAYKKEMFSRLGR